MSLGTTNRDGGKTSESGHLRAIYKALLGEVLSGFNVTQRGAGANMSVDIQIGDAVLPRSDGTYGHPIFNDAILNKTVTAADASNPRRDIVIAYLDYGAAVSTAVSNNTNGVVLTQVVAGTAAGSPVDPNAAALQAAAGSGNPYIKLARIRVGAGVTTLSNSVIDDLRKMAHGLSQGGWIYDPTYDWVYASATAFTVAAADVRTQFPNGTKLAVYQSGSIKYFVVTGSAFSTNTTVTVTGLGLHTLTNVPIDKPAYSYEQTPIGFPVAQAYNGCKFSAYRNAAWTSTSGSLGLVTPDTVEFDTGSNYSTSTGRFTAPTDGFYLITGAAAATTGGYLLCALYKNGAEIKRGNQVNMANTFDTQVTVGALLQLVAGDYVQLYFQDGGQPGATGAARTYLQGFRESGA